MRTKVWEEAERTKQDGTKAETDWISFIFNLVFDFQKYFHKDYNEAAFFRIIFGQDCPGSSAGQ